MGEPARQLTEPFTATPNRILDRLIGYRLPPTHRQVVDWIIRNTYGWHKPMVERDLCAISKALGIDKTAACRAIRSLLDQNVIIQEGRRIAVNPAVDAWGTPDADQEPTDAPIDISVKIEGENADATFYSFKEKKQPPVASHPESLFQKMKRMATGKKGVVKGILERIPEADRDRCKGLVDRYTRRMGAGYVERAVEYCLFREPQNFSAYLACALNEGWGEQWAEQKRQAAEMDAQRAEQAKARQAAMERERAEIEASNADYARQRDQVFSMPADELSRLEADFIGTLSGLRLKRYRKRGLKAVESEFVEYVEQRKGEG